MGLATLPSVLIMRAWDWPPSRADSASPACRLSPLGPVHAHSSSTELRCARTQAACGRAGIRQDTGPHPGVCTPGTWAPGSSSVPHSGAAAHPLATSPRASWLMWWSTNPFRLVFLTVQRDLALGTPQGQFRESTLKGHLWVIPVGPSLGHKVLSRNSLVPSDSCCGAVLGSSGQPLPGGWWAALAQGSDLPTQQVGGQGGQQGSGAGRQPALAATPQLAGGSVLLLAGGPQGLPAELPGARVHGARPPDLAAHGL